jgi:hypothetical protein
MVFDQLDYGLIVTLRIFFISGGAVLVFNWISKIIL